MEGQQPVKAVNAPPGERVFVSRQLLAANGMSVLCATEDIRAPTHWRIEAPHHTLVVHLAGSLRHLESHFARGPSSAARPSIGDIWAIPAGCAYAALAWGDRVRFLEFRVPAGLLGGGPLTPRIGHRDPFLYQASVRAAALAARGDDLGRMALAALLEALRHHIADAFLRVPQASTDPSAGRQRFSERQKRRLLDFIAASLATPMGVADMAAATGVSATRLVERFKASFGTTPWQYVLRARLAEGRRLLETDAASITQISILSGFASPSHFATAFRKHVGVTPQEYRREMREAGR